MHRRLKTSYKLINDPSCKSMVKQKRTLLSSCGVECPNENDIANAFDHYFADAGINISSKLPYVPLQTIP